MRFSAPGKIADFATVRQQKITGDMSEAFGRPAISTMEMAAVSAYKQAIAKEGISRPRATTVSRIIDDVGERAYRAEASISTSETIVRTASLVGDAGEATFQTDFPDAWSAVLSPQEAAVSTFPRPSFVRFISDEKPLFQ